MDDKDVADHAAAQARLTLQQQQFDAQQAELDRALTQYMKDVDAQIAQAQLSGEQAMNMDTLKVALAKESAKFKTEREKLRTQVQLAMRGGNSPQVATPSFEPNGRAQPGQAFQR